MKTDAEYMGRAIELAKRGLYTTDPNPRVGCVVVKDGEVIGEGWHKYAGGPHAEVHALEFVGEKARGSTVYVTLEPCCTHGRTPPCTEVLIECGVSRVVVATKDPNPAVSGKGIEKLENGAIDVHCGLLRTQTEALNPGFTSRMIRNRPWVRVKLAMSLDGRTAMANGDSRWVSGEAARRDVQMLRARASAILTGISTVLADDPQLNVRLDAMELDIEGTVRQPLRVVVDSRFRTPEVSNLMQTDGDVLIATIQDNKKIPGARVMKVGASSDRVDLGELMRRLAEQEINEVHVEAGATLCGALLEAQLVDEMVIYMAPHLMGGSAKGLFDLPALVEMNDRINLEISDIRAIGEDWRITAKPVY